MKKITIISVMFASMMLTACNTDTPDVDPSESAVQIELADDGTPIVVETVAPE